MIDFNIRSGSAAALALGLLVISVVGGCGVLPVSDESDETSAPSSTVGVPATVDRVVDGDSIELSSAGRFIELRLEGYNAPELFGTDADGKDVRTCQGTASLEAVRDALADVVESGQSVFLVDSGEDRFGRTLGDLLVDGSSLTHRLLAEGHGLATGDDVDHRRIMVTAAASAVGIWSDRCGSASATPLELGSIEVNPDGNDRFNLIEESVEVHNPTSQTVDLGGWMIRDDTTSHRFPLTGHLESGDRLTIRSGGQPAESDTDGGGTLFLGESFPVWSNSWETVILVDPAGVFVDWRFVEAGEVLDR